MLPRSVILSAAGVLASTALLVVACSSPKQAPSSGQSDAGADTAPVDAPVGDATAEAAPPGLKCGKLLACDQPCSTDACTNACFAEATGIAQGLFNALTNCIAAACPSGDGGPCVSSSSATCNSCNTQAATGACIGALEACEQDTTVGPADPDGGAVVTPHSDGGAAYNCAEYTACVAACPLDAGSCESSCTSQATAEAQALASSLDSCLQSACAADGGPCTTPGSACNGCVEQVEFGGTCSASYTACQNDTSNTPDGGTTPTPLQGGTLTTVLTGVNQTGSTMTVQGGYLYFAQEDGANLVSRIPLVDGGTLETIGPVQPTPVALAVSSTDAYVWNYGTFTGSSQLNNSDGVVNRIPLDGGAEQPIVQNVQVFYAAPYLNAIAADSQYVYWVQGASGNNGSIMRAALGTTNATAIYTGQSFPEAVVTDGTNVYWASWGTFDAQGNSNNDGTIMRGSINGGTVTTLASNLSAPACMALDSNSVYWTNLGKMGGDNLPALNTGSVMQVAIGGGTPVILASQESVPVGIALAGSTVYWTEYGLGSPGLVLSAPKGGGTIVPLVAGLKNPYSLALSSSTLFFSYYAASAPASPAPLIESLTPF